jgi:hypothetical protein
MEEAMKAILSSAALASIVVTSGLLVSTPTFAQDNQPCVGENCPATEMPDQGAGKKRMKSIDQNEQVDPGNQGQSESTDQLPRKKRAKGSPDNNVNVDVDVDADVNVGTQKSVRRGEWRFDSTRHQRRRSKDATFRFYFGGYWYPQPYWEVYSIGGRVSCGEGRAIVAARFNRVRVVECRGGTYTYLGRRQGDTYRILLNSRTGRIVGRALI